MHERVIFWCNIQCDAVVLRHMEDISQSVARLLVSWVGWLVGWLVGWFIRERKTKMTQWLSVLNFNIPHSQATVQTPFSGSDVATQYWISSKNYPYTSFDTQKRVKGKRSHASPWELACTSNNLCDSKLNVKTKAVHVSPCLRTVFLTLCINGIEIDAVFYSPISYFVAQVAEIDVHGFWLCDIQLPSRECKI